VIERELRKRARRLGLDEGKTAKLKPYVFFLPGDKFLHKFREKSHFIFNYLTNFISISSHAIEKDLKTEHLSDWDESLLVPQLNAELGHYFLRFIGNDANRFVEEFWDRICQLFSLEEVGIPYRRIEEKLRRALDGIKSPQGIEQLLAEHYMPYHYIGYRLAEKYFPLIKRMEPKEIRKLLGIQSFVELKLSLQRLALRDRL
jgi:hypothetical protein